MNHFMYDSSSANINFQVFLGFFALILYENYDCFLDEGRHNKPHLESSIGICYYQKTKEYVED